MEKLKLEDIQQDKKGLLSILQSPSQGISKYVIPNLGESQLPTASSTLATNGPNLENNSVSNRFNVPILLKGSSSLPRNDFIIPQLKSEDSNKIHLSIKTEKDQQNLKNVLANYKQVQHPEANLSDNIIDLASALSSAHIDAYSDHGDTKNIQNIFNQEEIKTNDNIIDLTTALSSTKIVVENSNKATQKIKRFESSIETFHIPFIDCDRQVQPLPTNDYCQIDISHENFQHCLVAPSSFGRIITFKAKKKRNFKNEEHQSVKSVSKAKHHIERFRFNTHSPDDIFIAALERFTRSK